MKNGFKSFIVKRYTALVVIAILIATAMIVILNKPALSLIPATEATRSKMYQVSTFDDAADNGTSTVSTPVVSEKSIQYTCKISNGIEYPYAGLSLFARPKLSKTIDSYLNFKGYTHIEVAGKIKGFSSTLISLKTFVKNLTNDSTSLTRQPNEYTITTGDSTFNKKLSLSEFQTPAWWYSANKTTKEKLGNPDYSQVMEIVVQSGDGSPLEQEITIEICEIKLTKDIRQQVAAILASLLLFLGSISIIRFSKTPKVDEKNDKIIISYDRVEIEDENDTDVHRIVEYIASHYSNPDFSVEQLAKGAGVSTSRIPTLLKKQYSMNFKQYLNTIRITEAKRLLLETDHQIVTIAHSVGYNNIPHFNRTFKQVTDLSPKQYRDNPEQAIDNLPGSGSK